MTEPDETAAGPDAQPVEVAEAQVAEDPGPLTAEQVPQLIPPQPGPPEEAAEAEADDGVVRDYVRWVGSPYIDKGLTQENLAALGVDPVRIPDGGLWWTKANGHQLPVSELLKVLTQEQLDFYIGTEQGRFVVVEGK